MDSDGNPIMDGLMNFILQEELMKLASMFGVPAPPMGEPIPPPTYEEIVKLWGEIHEGTEVSSTLKVEGRIASIELRSFQDGELVCDAHLIIREVEKGVGMASKGSCRGFMKELPDPIFFHVYQDVIKNYS